MKTHAFGMGEDRAGCQEAAARGSIALVVRPARPALRALLLVAIVMGSVLCGRAQNYSSDWYRFASGGGTSTGGLYTASGTIGQAEAGGPETAGPYSFINGFWALDGVTAPAAPVLVIERLSANSVRVSWPAPSTGCVLQECLGMGSSHWANVSCAAQAVNGRNQVIVTPLADKRFYRLAPGAAPALNVVRTTTNTVVLSWSGPVTTWLVQQCTNLLTFNWTNLFPAWQVVNGANQAVLPVAGDTPWYQLVELPRLAVQLTRTNTLVVSWPAVPAGFVLQECAELGSGYWANVPAPAQIVNGRGQVVVTPVAGKRFYRLAPAAVPALRIARGPGNTLLVAWPFAFADFALQQSGSLAAANWQSVTNLPVQAGGEWQVSLSQPAASRFYRLMKP